MGLVHSLLDLGDCQADDLDLGHLTDDRASPAYAHGLLVIAFLAGTPAGTPTGALLLSPYAQEGSLDAKRYDPSALLRSVEDVLALKPLGKAEGAPSFARPALRPAFG